MARPVVRRREKSGVAAVLSFFCPGAGQVYNGDIGRGLLFFFGFVLSIVTIIGPPFVWIWSIVDAHEGKR